MTLFAEIAGSRIIAGRVTIPYCGMFHADVTIDREVSSIPAGSKMTIGDLEMVVTPWRPVAPYQGRTNVRLIGGYGGWRKPLPERGYSSPAGVRASLVLTHAATACGEKIEIGSPFASKVVGLHFARVRDEPACHVLNTIARGAWRLDADGITRVGVRTATTLATPLIVTSFDGARGLLVLASEKIRDLRPAVTVQSVTLKAPVTIASLVHTITEKGLRTEAMTL